MTDISFLQILGYVLQTVVVIVVGLVTAAAFYLHSKRKRYAHIPGPPLDSFWFGNLPSVIKAQKEGKPFVVLFEELVKEYGKTVKLVAINHIWILTLDIESVKDLLVTGGFSKPENIYKILKYLYGARWMGDGILSQCDNEQWKRQRALFNPVFHRQFLLTLMPQFNSTGDVLMKRLSDFADGKTMVSMLNEFNRAALDVIGKVAFNMDIGGIDNENDSFHQAVKTTFEGVDLVHNPFSKIDPRLYSFRKKVREACNLLRKTGKNCINARRLALAKGEYCPEDILSRMISVLDENPDIDMEFIIDQFVTFFIAGQETTSTTLGHVLTEVGRNPHVYRSLQQEVDEVMGDRFEVTYADLGKLSYLGNVIKETLRLHPVVDLTSRRLHKDHLVGGYLIPQDATIMLSTYIASRREENNKDALTFNPDRFSGDPSTRPNIYTYFPFSLGPRSCIGQNFAMMETKALLCKFMQRFEFTLDPDQSFEMEQKFTLQPKGKAMCTLSMRENK